MINIKDLNRQEAVIDDSHYSCKDEIYTYWFRCPNCNKDMIMIDATYCQDCGIKLIWKHEKEYK